MNVAKFSQYESYLVYAREGSKEFTLKKDNQGGHVVDMSPYYLTWDTENTLEKNSLDDRPYQLIAINLFSK